MPRSTIPQSIREPGPERTRPEDLAVHRKVDVPLSPEDAFRLFTEDLGRWWPMERYSVSAGSAAGRGRVHVTPGKGGRITETLPGGGTADWATIRTWQPGARLRLAWYPGEAEEAATDVDIRFEPIADGTRVTVVHTGFARRGAGATAMAGRYRDGWSAVLARALRGACPVAA